MTLKVVANELFGMEAVIGWLSSGFLFMIHFLSVSNTISNITALGGTLLALTTGFFAMLKMKESWQEQKAKRKIQEEKLKDLQEDEHVGI